MLNGGSMVWGFCVYFVYMIPLETDVLRKHRFQKIKKRYQVQAFCEEKGLLAICLYPKSLVSCLKIV